MSCRCSSSCRRRASSTSSSGDFGAERLAQIDESMRPGVVDLYLPRWEDSLSVDLVATLPELGLTLPFDKGVADFTGIAPKDPYISAAIHAANIEVNEQGTVAAAATAIVVTPTSPPPPADAVIRADRPFLYLIRDTETGAVLFLGSLARSHRLKLGRDPGALQAPSDASRMIHPSCA